jgi:hypothetical protein
MFDDAAERLAHFALPHAIVHLLPIGSHELRIVAREVRVQSRICIGVDARVIGEEILHRIEAMIDRHGVDRIAQVPFS